MPEALVAKGQYNDNAAVFATTHLTNGDSTDGTLHPQVWRSPVGSSGLFNVLESAPLIRYDAWNTIELRVMPAENKDEYRVEYRLNGEAILAWNNPCTRDPSLGIPDQFFRAYLFNFNTDDPIDAHWSRLTAGSLISGDDIGSRGGDVIIDPDEGASRNVRVKDDDRFGGSLWIKNGAGVTGSEGGNPIRVNGPVTVDETSSLRGNWGIESDLEVAGVLAPGNSIGTVKVGGDHTFVSGATYRVEIDADGNNDLLEVGGIARLAGTVQASPEDGPGDFRLGHAYTIVDAGGGFDETRFDGVSWSAAMPFLAPYLSYDPTHAFLTIRRSEMSFAGKRSA